MLEQLRTPGCLSALSRGAAVSGLADSGSDVLTSHAGRARHALGRSAPTGRPNHREGAGHVGAAGPVDRVGLRRVSSPRWWRRSLSFPFRAGCAPCSRCRPPRAPWRFSVGRPAGVVRRPRGGRPTWCCTWAGGDGGPKTAWRRRRSRSSTSWRPAGRTCRGRRAHPDNLAGRQLQLRSVHLPGANGAVAPVAVDADVREDLGRAWTRRPSPGGPRSAAAPDLCCRLSRCR